MNLFIFTLLSLRPYGSRDFEIGSCRQQGFLFCFGECVRGLFLILEQYFNFKAIFKRKYCFLLSMNQFFAYKTQLISFDWTFYVTWINLLLTKQHKITNFDGIDNNLIVHDLLINYLNFKKRANTEAAAHWCS